MGKVSLLDVSASLSEILRSFSAAVITGGSSGLGQAFIGLGHKLHSGLWFCNLSRRPPATFSAEKGLRHIPCDLGRESELEHAASQVLAWLRTAPEGRVLLINNSGFGTYGPFPEPNVQQNLEMLDVNVRAPVHLTGLLLPELRRRGGAIVNIASTAALVPVVYNAAYAASKAFLLHWGLALNEELRGSNLRVLTVCPGTTATSFFMRAGVGTAALRGRATQTPDAVACEALQALGRRRALVVTGWRNRLMLRAVGLLPRTAATRMTAAVMQRYWRRQCS